ncbi:MAG: L-threonylcarbamoyladenylate synthase [Acidimicrobiales bacterium]
MAASVIKLDALGLGDAVAQVVAVLRDGGVALLPTDTVYGITALPDDRLATERLFALKGRAETAPVAVLCTDVDQAISLADPLAADALTEMGARWWPGPLTVVVRRRTGVELHLGEPATTIGLRVPDHALVRAVAAVTGPIAATSANRHGDPTPATVDEAIASLGPGVSLVVDDGPLASSASTVVDATGAAWVVLRDGPISGADVIAVSDAGVDDAR